MSDIDAITYDDAVAVTESNTTADPAGPFAALLVTAVGTVKLRTVRGHDIVYSATAVGQIIPFATAFVWSTGTSATVLGCLALPFKGTTPRAGT